MKENWFGMKFHCTDKLVNDNLKVEEAAKLSEKYRAAYTKIKEADLLEEFNFLKDAYIEATI